VERWFAIAGALSALIAVALGAFGAHLLRSRLPAEMLAVFETGVRYHMYHSLALLATAFVASRWPGSQAMWAGWFFGAGIVIFSGSLYLLAVTGTRWWGAITPIGGLLFFLGWGCLAWAIARSADAVV
jgi:uncharacterized membrane protein YgdD (TMEM256/DUF423 family)